MTPTQEKAFERMWHILITVLLAAATGLTAWVYNLNDASREFVTRSEIRQIVADQIAPAQQRINSNRDMILDRFEAVKAELAEQNRRIEKSLDQQARDIETIRKLLENRNRP